MGDANPDTRETAPLSYERIETAALRLPEEDRERLCETLLSSLSTAYVLGEEWDAENGRRIAGAHAGTVRMIPADDVMREGDELLSEDDPQAITERLNRVYDSLPSTLDPMLKRVQAASIGREDWADDRDGQTGVAVQDRDPAAVAIEQRPGPAPRRARTHRRNARVQPLYRS